MIKSLNYITGARIVTSESEQRSLMFSGIVRGIKVHRPKYYYNYFVSTLDTINLKKDHELCGKTFFQLNNEMVQDWLYSHAGIMEFKTSWRPGPQFGRDKPERKLANQLNSKGNNTRWILMKPVMITQWLERIERDKKMVLQIQGTVTQIYIRNGITYGDIFLNEKKYHTR